MKRFTLVLLSGFLVTSSADADLVLPFSRITSNNATDISSQLQVQIDQTNVNSDQVRFKISNLGPLASEVTEVYWEDTNGLIENLAPLLLDMSSGVGFQTQDVNPGALPGGNDVGFVSTYGADEGKPSGPMTVDPGSGVTAGTMAAFQFDLAGTNTYQAVEQAILAGDLRLGLHVRSINVGGIGDGSSDSFVSAVPEPSSFLLLGLVGIATYFFNGRRRVK